MKMRSVMTTIIATIIYALGSHVSLAVPPAGSQIYPLAVGAKWVYQAGPVELVEEVTSFDMVDGERCARVETSINGKSMAYEHIAVRADGIYRVSIAGERVVPPVCFLKFPAPAGTRWDVNSTVNGVSISGQFVTGEEKVSIQTGHFTAVTVRGTKFESDAGPLEFTYFFVPGIGKVKQGISTRGKSAELTLKEYVPAR